MAKDKKNDNKKTTVAKKDETASRADKEKKVRKISPDSTLHQVMPILLVALAALLGICVYTQVDMGLFRTFVASVFFGLLGAGGAYLIPVWLLLSAVRWRADAREEKLLRAQICGWVVIFIVSILCYTFGMPIDKLNAVREFYSLGLERVGGGILGGLLGFAFNKLFSKIGTVIVMISLFAVVLLITYGKDLKRWMLLLFRYISERAEKAKEKRLAEK